MIWPESISNFLATLLFCLLGLAASVRADEAKPDVGPPAKWIAPLAFNPRAKLDEVDPSLELRWILKDRQVDAENNEFFHHEVYQVLTPSGVENNSHISVDYDPAYQLLTFHWVKIWRGTNAFNRLDPDKILVTQPGLDTDELLFDADKTALILINDVRVGDIIDFAYTLQGNNVVLAGHYSDHINLQTTAPVERMRTRLIWPAARHLYVKNHNTDVKYAAVRRANSIEFTWNMNKATAWHSEPQLPAWYNPRPWVQLSEYHKWSEVNQLALGLFTNAAPLSQELKQKISEWKHLPDREQQILAALQFVQDEVRYLGIESGATGYQPAAPATVFDRRFGDCKDKSFLLVTILRALGVEAWPALVNTRLHRGIAELQPTMTAFNHAIVQVNQDGATYWLDGTTKYQRGPLPGRSWPDYGYALVVRPGATALTDVAPSPVQPKTTVSEYIQLGHLDQPSSMKVITVAEGQDADTLRAYYATTTRDAIERANVNYYARIYPEITQTAPLNFIDDEQANRVQVEEFYSIQNIWSHLPADTSYHCLIYPVNIGVAVDAPTVSLRTMPLGLNYPNHQIFHAQIDTPLLMIFQPDDQVVDNPAFYFHRTTGFVAGKVFLDYEYRALTDTIQPDSVPNYVRQLDAAAKLVSYTISSN